MAHVLFLCRGNICRSPTAEWLFRKMCAEQNLPHTTESAGTGTWHVGKGAHPPAIACATTHGLDLSGHIARHVSADMLSRADIITVPDARCLGELKQLLGDHPKFAHVRFLRSYEAAGDASTELEDPYHTERYDLVYEQITASLAGILASL